MTVWEGIKAIATGKKPFYKVFDYLLGNYRYKLYYSKNSFIRGLMRTHIREQIHYRIAWMNPDCFLAGMCKHCGCETTALQMCNRVCEGLCYPPMMSFLDWEGYKSTGLITAGLTKDKYNSYWCQNKFGKPELFIFDEKIKNYVQKETDTARQPESWKKV